MATLAKIDRLLPTALDDRDAFDRCVVLAKTLPGHGDYLAAHAMCRDLLSGPHRVTRRGVFGVEEFGVRDLTQVALCPGSEDYEIPLRYGLVCLTRGRT